MEVAILTLEQARNLNKKFGYWGIIEPTPLNNGTFYITQRAALALKAKMIDEVGVNPRHKEKALEIWNVLKDCPRGELNDYPHLIYNTKIDFNNITAEQLAEMEERAERYAELNFENIT